MWWLIINLIVCGLNFYLGWQKQNRYAKYNLIAGGWLLGIVTWMIVETIMNIL
jgi:hypothetical protein